MLDNSQIADTFEEMADLLEIKGESSFRVRAYRNGAKAIRDLSESVTSILQDSSRKLTDIDGIGDTLAEKTKVLVDTGHIPQLETLRKEIPPSLLILLRVPGLGAKKAAILFKELGIENLEQLRVACQEQKLRALKGFGAKTEQSILQSIDLVEAASRRMLLDQAETLVQQLRQHLRASAAIEQLEFAGSYRRGKETVGDLDILVVSQYVDQVMDQLGSFAAMEQVIARGETKMSIRVQGGFQVDLRVVPAASFGAALQYFTGSKEHNVEMRSRAKKLHLRLNEYGLFPDGVETSVAGTTEEEIYKTLGLAYVPPELRENRGEFAIAEQGIIPDLLQYSDLKGDLHMHTTATDGEATLEEMVDAARSRGWEYIAITDHSQRVSMARGLNAERLLAQWQQIDQLNERLAGAFRVLKGIECDILEAGGMDLPDEVLAQADWVLGSVHYGQKQPRQQITDRIIGAIENPHVDAIAHPTGRLLGRRPAYEVDLDAVFQATKSYGKTLELNANPNRLDLSDALCMQAVRMGIPLVINSDAHSISNFDLLHFGIIQARRAQLKKEHIINTLSLAELLKLLERS